MPKAQPQLRFIKKTLKANRPPKRSQARIRVKNRQTAGVEPSKTRPERAGAGGEKKW